MLLTPTAQEQIYAHKRGKKIIARMLVECIEDTYPATNKEGFHNAHSYVADELLRLKGNDECIYAVYQVANQKTWEDTFTYRQFQRFFRVKEAIGVR